MASLSSSKTCCPVCKTFSSSSNTTLNAHIDQCLASGSKQVVSAAASSFRAVVKHKIKPRKIRMMTDVYTTAKECTLEELDRRNGTSWAAMGSKDVQEEGDRRRSTMDRSRESAGCDHHQANNVYVDANGTKVRILSKLDDHDDGAMAKNPMKKKRCHGKKKHKYLKLVPQSSKLSSPKTHPSQVDPKGSSSSRGEDREGRGGGGPKRIKLVSLPGSSRELMPSKLTALTKEASKKDYRRNLSSCGNDDEPCPRGLLASRKKAENVAARLAGNKAENAERPRMLPTKRNTDDSSNASASLFRVPIPRSAEKDGNRVSPLGRKKTVCSSAGSRKGTEESPRIASRTLEVPSWGRRVSIRHESAVRNKLLCTGETRFRFKKTGWNVLDEKDDDDEEFLARERSRDWENTLMQNGSGNRRHPISRDSSSFDTSEPVSREERLASESPRMVSRYYQQDNGEIAARGERLASENPRMVSRYSQQDNGEITASSPRVFGCYDDESGASSSDSDSESEEKDEYDHNDNGVVNDLDCGRVTEERAVTSLSSFLGTEFIRRSHPETPFDSLADEFTGVSSEGRAFLRSSEPSFLGGSDEYSAHDDLEGAIRERDTCMDMDMDSETGQGSFYPEIEPIPIPGPPSSFLPSPRYTTTTTSEDFPGHSSLVISPVRSSEDPRDFVDRVSSDSPLSMVSTVSNSRPDHMKYFEQLSSSSGMAPGQEKNPDSAVSSLQTSVDTERQPEVENLDSNVSAAAEKGIYGFRSDDQPCCCQRKERSLSSQRFISLNFQESQLLLKQGPSATTGFLPGGSDHPRFEPTAPSNNPCTALPGPGPWNRPEVATTTTRIRPSSDTDFTTTTSPSACNPVLRLMGKNLMVINTEEETSAPVISSNPPLAAAAPSFHHIPVPRGSFPFDRDSCDAGDYFRSDFSAQVTQNPFQSHCSAPFALFNPQDYSSSSSAHSIASNPQNPDRFSAIKKPFCGPEDPRKIHRSSLVATTASSKHLSSSLFYS